MPPLPFGPYQVGSISELTSKLSAIVASPARLAATTVAPVGVVAGGGVVVVAGTVAPLSTAPSERLAPLVPQPVTTASAAIRVTRRARRMPRMFNKSYPPRI
jgi:hypothetical protein